MFLDNDAKQNKKILLSFSFEKILLQKNLKIFFMWKAVWLNSIPRIALSFFQICESKELEKNLFKNYDFMNEKNIWHFRNFLNIRNYFVREEGSQ